MHLLVAGQRIEFLDPGLDVVAQHPLTGGDGGQVDVVEDPFVIADGGLGNLDPQFRLGPQHRQPEPPLGDDLGLRRPDRHHLGTGVTVGQNVRDCHKHTA